EGAWDYPPYVVDTVFNISQDLACSMTNGKMALVWTANLPNAGDCDTCSGESDIHVQLDNDIYYQISDNYGADFNPRVNVTKNVSGEAGYRPYTDLSALITQDATNGVNALHIGWSGRVWPSCANHGGFIGDDCLMFHFGQNLGSDGNGFDGPDPQTANAIIRTAGNLDWHQTTCNGGAWQMNGSKMTISECNGRLYYLWVQFNDPKVMMDDCAARGMSGADVVGSANGELYLAVSDDGGLSWDQARNLTNSHTPGCDSATGIGGRCESDHYPSMARFGTDIIGDDMTGAEILIPTGTLAEDNGWYLDVQFISDPDPGTIVQNEGTWQNADVKWFRLGCVLPEPTPLLAPSWASLGFPSWTKHGVIHDTDLVLENTGNSAATFEVGLEEDTGPPGWLDVSGDFQGTVVLPSGLAGIMTGQVYINALGEVNTPGTITYLSGRLILTGNHIGSPTTIEIEHWVCDTIITPVWDTIYAGTGSKYTACMALLVGSNGNMGGHGGGGAYYNSEPMERMSGDGSSGGLGHVNMDYYDYGDCDDAEEGSEGDTIPGDATVYAYDGSPVICWIDATDTVRCNWSIFGDGFHCNCSNSGDGYISDHGFFPWSHTPPELSELGDYEVFKSEFVTRDTGIMFETQWIAPRAAVDSCHFLIQYMSIYSYDGETHTGLAIGEAIDWDIPSDSASRNRSGFDADLRLIYQQGSEFDQDDAYECMDNDDRYGGIELLRIIENGSPAGEQYGCYTADNRTQVYPTSGFNPDSIYTRMANNEGYVLSDTVDGDLHSVMTFRFNYTLTPDDTLEVYKCLITSNVDYYAFLADAEACHQWYRDHLEPNWPPELSPINPSGEPVVFMVDQERMIDVSASDGNEDDDITLTAVPDPAMPGSQWVDNGNGTGVFTWTPSLGDVGNYTITFMADDGQGGIDVEVVDVEVLMGGCCVIRGDVDHDGFPVSTISDLMYMVDYMYTNGPEPPCWDEGDINGDGVEPIDIADLLWLVDYMFHSGAHPPPCDHVNPVPVYPGGSISLHAVDGLYETIDQVSLGDTVTFHMRVSNQDIGAGVKAMMNGFRIYGDDPGVNWTITETGLDLGPWFDGGWSIKEFSVNGSGADTLGSGGYASYDQGLLDHLDSLLFYIQVYVPDNSGNRDQWLCIDSSFFPPCGVWKWAAEPANGIYSPSWSGPHCFKMVHVSDLEAGFSAAPTAGVDPLAVQFTDESAGDPDDWYWDFGDSEYSAAQDPLHTYDTAGLYDVKLRVQDGSGNEDSVVAIGYIQVRTSGYTDVVAQIEMSPGGSIPGNDLWYRFSWINLGTNGAQSCVLKMLLPDNMVLDGLKDSLGYVMSPGDYSWVGDTIVVSLQTIQPSNVWRHVIPYGTLSPSSVPGSNLVAKMWLSGSTPDVDTLNNYARHSRPVSDPGGKARSYDRSVTYSGDKTAHPNTINRVYATGKDVEYLSYTITFENSPDANLDISSVTVTDILDDHLDMSVQSLDVWGNSHPQACQYAGIDPLTRIMTWNCIKINLQPGEKGSFQYKVAPVQGVAEGTWILNTADIGFGFDDPITAPGEGPVIRILGECCIPPIRGDIDYNDAEVIDIADLVYLVDFMFNQGLDPVCFEEGDVDGSGVKPIDIADLVYLVDFMFN
ncbi:MAG: PKD domain-containing protein, partial [candidate division Zixibacteria bacterium]|nr:PKD domain-containing protein [candidate division Zixibacteria bacterium]